MEKLVIKTVIGFFIFITFTLAQENSCQNSSNDIYIYFPIDSKETCKIDVEGKGYLNLPKYQKEVGQLTLFKICDEQFTTKSNFKVLSSDDFETIEITPFAKLKELVNSRVDFKHHIFDKISLIEFVDGQYRIYENVSWRDEMLVIDD